MKQQIPKISIVIVHYKNTVNLFNCINSILNSTYKNIEIIVIDNNPFIDIGKKLASMFNHIAYISNKKNIGYGSAINQGFNVAKGDLLFLCNPDVLLKPNCLTILLSIFKGKNVGIACPMYLDESGNKYNQMGSSRLTPIKAIFSMSIIFKLLPNNLIANKYWVYSSKLNKLKSVDVVPGSAMLVRRDVFEKVGGFDPNFFLYFEESDFCKRVKELGYEIYIVPSAKITHIWKGSTPKSKKIQQIFNKSRYYYFKKHYGILNAFIVEAFCRFSKWEFILILILILGVILRFYRLEENLVFHGELGHNYLAMKNIIETKSIPLLGPPTSHPWLSFGPLFYWFFTPLLFIGNYNPIFIAKVFALLGVILILINYLTLKNIFNRRIAILSSFLISFSPLFMDLTRESRFFSIVALLIYPFMYLLYKSKSNTKFLFLLGLTLGIVLNFHLTAIILIPLVFFSLNLKKTRLNDYIILASGLLIPNIPFIIFNLNTNFEMLTKIILWLPYRIAGALGVVDKNVINSSVLQNNLQALKEFLTNSFIYSDSNLVEILCLLIVAISILYLLIYKRLFKYKLLLIWFGLGILALFIHGSPPSHYFLPLYSFPIIIISIFLSHFMSGRKQIVIGLIIFIVFLSNINYYFSEKWFYKRNDILDTNKAVPYLVQVETMKYIVQDAKANSYKLRRVGYSDQFEGQYAQNYYYLGWLLGNEPNESGKLTYTIIEEPPFIKVQKIQ